LEGFATGKSLFEGALQKGLRNLYVCPEGDGRFLVRFGFSWIALRAERWFNELDQIDKDKLLMFQPPNKFWTLIFVCVVFALPLPPAERSRADKDEAALQPSGNESVVNRVGGDVEASRPADVAQEIDTAALEARVLARLRHQMHAEVDDVAMRSMEQAMRRLRDRDEVAAWPLGKVLRMTFELEPEVAGVAPVSVLTRTTSYSAFADTVLGGTAFRLNVVGDLALKGVHHDRVILDFSTLLQIENFGNEESGSSGATGSAELEIGRPEVLMSVGARDLVLTISEVR
jgi:hypothetical protein